MRDTSESECYMKPSQNWLVAFLAGVALMALAVSAIFGKPSVFQCGEDIVWVEHSVLMVKTPDGAFSVRLPDNWSARRITGCTRTGVDVDAVRYAPSIDGGKMSEASLFLSLDDTVVVKW